MNLGALLGILRGTQKVGTSKSVQEKVAKRLEPFIKKTPNAEPKPAIPVKVVKASAGVLMLSGIILLVWQFYDINIVFRDWFYHTENSFSFPGESGVFHLFTGLPFVIILSMFLVYTLLIIFRPVGRAYFISDLIDNVKFSTGGKKDLTPTQILERYSLNKYMMYSLYKPVCWLLVLGLIWFASLWYVAKDFTQVNSEGFTIIKPFSIENKPWNEVEKFRIALNKRQSNFPVFEIVFKDQAVINVWAHSLYGSEPKKLMRLIDHLTWRKIKPEQWTLPTMFRAEETGLSQSKQKVISMIRDYSIANPYSFSERLNLKNTSPLFQSLFKKQIKTNDPGWVILNTDYTEQFKKYGL